MVSKVILSSESFVTYITAKWSEMNIDEVIITLLQL